MYSEDFAARLSHLRNEKGISARDMSLSLGQNPAYINNIENGKALPSMNSFFYICDYLGISPRDFFDTDSPAPEKVSALTEDLRRLSPEQLAVLSLLIAQFFHHK